VSEVRLYLNGDIVSEADARLSVFDSGLNFADGVFEGMRVYDGAVFRLHEHVRRLYDSANALSLDIGMPPARFADELLGWLRANEVRDGFHFRPIVTRGRRFPPRLDPRFATERPTVLFVGGPVTPTSPGLRVVVSSVRRPNPDAFDSKIKSLNYGGNLLARLEAIRQGADDAVMLDSSGFLAEATAANLFLVRGDTLLTPWPKVCLDGITRRAIVGLARDQGLDVVERDLTTTELINADEVFLSGTSAELTPVVEVDGRGIGDGEIGPRTAALQEAYGRLVRSEGTPIA
jgi:branched-chain amino acid aminotransferase